VLKFGEAPRAYVRSAQVAAASPSARLKPIFRVRYG